MNDERDDKAVELLRQIRDFNTRADILGDLQGHYGSTGDPDFAGELADILRQIDELSPPEPTLPYKMERVNSGQPGQYHWRISTNDRNDDCVAASYVEANAKLVTDALNRPLDADADGLRERCEKLQAVIDKHDLCHDLDTGEVSADDFAAGCRQKQREVYGRCPDADRIVKLLRANAELAAANDGLRERCEKLEAELKQERITSHNAKATRDCWQRNLDKAEADRNAMREDRDQWIDVAEQRAADLVQLSAELAARPDAKLLADVEPWLVASMKALQEAFHKDYDAIRKLESIINRVRAAQAETPKPPGPDTPTPELMDALEKTMTKETCEKIIRETDAAHAALKEARKPKLDWEASSVRCENGKLMHVRVEGGETTIRDESDAIVHRSATPLHTGIHLAMQLAADSPTPPSELAGKIVVKPPMPTELVERLTHYITEGLEWRRDCRFACDIAEQLLADLAKVRDPLPGVTAEMCDRWERVLLFWRDRAARYGWGPESRRAEETRIEIRAARDRLRAATNAEGGAV